MAEEDWAAAADEQERRLTGQVSEKKSKTLRFLFDADARAMKANE